MSVLVMLTQPYAKVRYRRDIAKNAAQLSTLFSPSNLWMARRTLAGMEGLFVRRLRRRGKRATAI